MGPVVLGSLAAAALKGIFGGIAKRRQNRYNEPKQQLKRLRAAGLPLAYMYSGKVNQQGQSQELDIDPSLGIAEDISKTNETSMTEANLKILAEELKQKENDTLNKQKETDWKQSDITPTGKTNQVELLEHKKAIADSNRWIARHEEQLKDILVLDTKKLFNEGVTKDERREGLKATKQKITNLLKQDEVMTQLMEIRSMESTVNQTISDDIENMDGLMKSVYTLLLKLFSKSAGK